MKTNFLFPHKFKRIGWIILIPVTIFGILQIIFDYQLQTLNTKVFAVYSSAILKSSNGFFQIYDTNITGTLTGVLFLIGALLVAFSKERNEDEYISKLRMESLIWATYVNYALLLLMFVFVWGLPFLTVMMFNMFTTLIFFIIRFNMLLQKSKNLAGYEK